MKGLWRRLGVRFLVVSIAIGLVGVVSSHLAAKLVVRETVYAVFAPFARDMLDRHELPRCEAHPETWSLALEDGARFFAYDAQLASRNPAAPAIRRDLYDEFARTGDRTALYPLGPFTGGVAFYRTERGGDCALVQAIYPAPAVAKRHVFDASLVGVLLVVTSAVFFGFLAIIRPLADRIHRVRLAAERVGDAEGYRSSAEAGGGELNEITTMLDRAHDRIRADAESLLEAQQGLQRYLADVAHDLRTPLTSLTLALEQASDAADDAERRALLTQALKDAVYLSSLTNNLRLASQLEKGWDPFADAGLVDLGDTAQRVVSRARVFAKRRGIEVDVAVPDAPVQVRANAIALEQAVANVVDNAIAYNDEGGHVAVILEATKDRFTLRVVDDGPGVPAADLPRLGERTFRSDEARRRDPRGSGLGLAITNEVCLRCGFDLELGNEEPRGLAVTMEGPRRT